MHRFYWPVYNAVIPRRDIFIDFMHEYIGKPEHQQYIHAM